jgi:hypothetical protein
VEAELDGASVTLHFHPRCHDAWKLEIEAHTSESGLTESERMPTSAA